MRPWRMSRATLVVRTDFWAKSGRRRMGMSGSLVIAEVSSAGV